MPAEWTTASSARARPAPRRQAAIPNGRASICVMTPDSAAVTVWDSRGAGRAASGSPSCARIIARQASIARPSRSAASTSASGLPGEGEHLARERDRQLDDVGGAAPGEHFDGLADLVGVADREAERGVHVGEECGRRDAGVGAERHHRPGELAGAVDVLHEGARAELHVEHERVGALGDLLRHDARGDERDRLDGSGDVAERVELLVGRCQTRAGGADHGAHVAQLREELVVRERGPPPGNGLELVEGAAGVAEAPARQLRHGDAERGHQRARAAA